MKNILRTSVFMIAVITIFLNINIGMENQNSGNLFNNVENLAYGEHNNSNNSNNFQGPSTSYRITCATSTTTTTNNGNNSNNEWSINGNIGMGNGLFGGNVGGNAGGGNSNSNGHTSTTTTTTTSERTGYDCPRQNSSNCNPFRPC
jgi:hypothetical protein